MDVEAEDVEPSHEGVGHGCLRLGRWEPELRAVVPGDDGLVRVRVDAERDAHEHALDAHVGGHRYLVGGVHDDRCGLGGGVAEKRVALVVPVHDELDAGEAGRAREGELARRGDVGADALLEEQAEHCDVRKRLGAVEDTATFAYGSHERSSLLPERLLAVDDDRRPEALRQLGRANPAEPQLARLDARRSGKEIEHAWILPGTVFSS